MEQQGPSLHPGASSLRLRRLCRFIFRKVPDKETLNEISLMSLVFFFINIATWGFNFYQIMAHQRRVKCSEAINPGAVSSLLSCFPSPTQVTFGVVNITDIAPLLPSNQAPSSHRIQSGGPQKGSDSRPHYQFICQSSLFSWDF